MNYMEKLTIIHARVPGVTTSLFTALALGAGFPEWPTFDLGPARVVKCSGSRHYF